MNLRNCLVLFTLSLIAMVGIAYYQQERREVPAIAHNTNLAKRLEQQEANLRTEIRALHKHLRKKQKSNDAAAVVANVTQKPALNSWMRFLADMQRLDARMAKMKNGTLNDEDGDGESDEERDGFWALLFEQFGDKLRDADADDAERVWNVRDELKRREDLARLNAEMAEMRAQRSNESLRHERERLKLRAKRGWLKRVEARVNARKQLYLESEQSERNATLSLTAAAAAAALNASLVESAAGPMRMIERILNESSESLIANERLIARLYRIDTADDSNAQADERVGDDDKELEDEESVVRQRIQARVKERIDSDKKFDENDDRWKQLKAAIKEHKKHTH